MPFFRTLFVAALGATTIAASAQSIYKCGNTFSELPCGPDAKQIGKPAPSEARLLPDKPPSEDRIAANLALCERTVRTSLKDPGAAKIEPLGRVGPAFQYRMGERVAGVNYAVTANGKNSYGAYTGSKTFICGFDAAETSIFFTEEQRR